MTVSQAISLYGCFLLVILAEHLILKYVYGKQSSIERILQPSPSAKTDLSVWSAYYFAIPTLKQLGRLSSYLVLIVTVPGLAYVAVSFLTKYLSFQGLFGAVVPTHGILGFVFWLLAHDLALYLSHVLMHKVPWLWSLHKLHHAPIEMNIVTGTRLSLGEHGFNALGLFLLLNVVLGVTTARDCFWRKLICCNTPTCRSTMDAPVTY